MANDLYFDGRKTDRATFEDRAKRIASIFRLHNVGEDDCVAVLLRNDTAYLEIIQACRYVGAHFASLNWHNPAADLIPTIQDSGAKLLVGHSDLTAVFTDKMSIDIPILALRTPPELLRNYKLNPDIMTGQIDLGALIDNTPPIDTPPLRYRGLLAYTSGSTGRPKGIRRIHDTGSPDPYLTYKGLAKAVLQLGPGNRFYTSAPLYHSAPNTLSVFTLAADYAELYIAPKFDAESFLADIERYSITHIYIVPTMMVRLLKLPKAVREKYDVSSLKFSITTGSAWPADIKQAMIDWFGPIFYESYGASEIGFMTLISSAESQAKPGSVGKVLEGGSIKILDENKAPVPTGEAGLIYVYLPMFGSFTYSNAEGALAKQRDGEHTTVGDIGYLDGDGYLYISDRKKDMIISGGANIFPAEIEAALIKMPEIYDCAVFGAPDPEFGEQIIAAVQCVDGQSVSLKTVQTFLEGRIARFKFPRQIDLHDSLPREDSGKIFKHCLRAPYWDGVQREI